MLSRSKVQFSLLIFHLSFVSCYGSIFCCENTSILSVSCIWKECNWKARKWCACVKLGNKFMWIFPNSSYLFPSPQGSGIFENLHEIWGHYSNFNNHYFITPNKHFFAEFSYSLQHFRANVQLNVQLTFVLVLLGKQFFKCSILTLKSMQICDWAVPNAHDNVYFKGDIPEYYGLFSKSADLMCLWTTCEDVIKMMTQHKWTYWMHLYNPNC